MKTHSSAAFPVKKVIGNDGFCLYGQRRRPKRPWLSFKNYTLSESSEREFLVYEDARPSLSSLGGPEPRSNHPDYDEAVRKKLDAPLWERAYEVTGDIVVPGAYPFVVVDGYLFYPSSGEKPPYFDNARRRTVLGAQKTGSSIHHDTVLMLRHRSDYVYYHTYKDILCKLVWADELGIDSRIPVVISKKWADSRAGRHFLKTPLFEDREVIVQDPGEFLHCRRLYWLCPPQYWRPHLDVVADSFKAARPPGRVGKNLILVRKHDLVSERIISGVEVLKKELQKQGFSAIDPADLSIPQQKWVFSRAERIVAENGSGLTNVIYRQGRPLRLHTLLLSDYLTATFQALCKAYGYEIFATLLQSKKEDGGIHGALDSSTIDEILNGASVKRGLYRNM